MSITFGFDLEKMALDQLVDEALTLSETIADLKIKHIKDLEESLDVLKDKITREFDASGVKSVSGKKGTVTWQTRNTKKVDIDTIIKEYRIPKEEVAKHTKNTESKFIVIRKK